MLIWHKDYKDGKVEWILFDNLIAARIAIKGARFIDMSAWGIDGCWTIETQERDHLGKIYNPDIFRVFGKPSPLYKDFYDENMRFSQELFRLNYKGT